jgi:hypothetical protein
VHRAFAKYFEYVQVAKNKHDVVGINFFTRSMYKKQREKREDDIPECRILLGIKFTAWHQVYSYYFYYHSSDIHRNDGKLYYKLL